MSSRVENEIRQGLEKCSPRESIAYDVGYLAAASVLQTANKRLRSVLEQTRTVPSAND
jgi:hypothetical protein